MNEFPIRTAGVRLLAAALVLGGAVACSDEVETRTSAGGPGTDQVLPSGASPSAQVIGQAPNMPAANPGSTAETTPPAGARSSVDAQAESTKRPLEGDNHSYSTLAPDTPQKAENAEAQERK